MSTSLKRKVEKRGVMERGGRYSEREDKQIKETYG